MTDLRLSREERIMVSISKMCERKIQMNATEYPDIDCREAGQLLQDCGDLIDNIRVIHGNKNISRSRKLDAIYNEIKRFREAKV